MPRPFGNVHDHRTTRRHVLAGLIAAALLVSLASVRQGVPLPDGVLIGLVAVVGLRLSGLATFPARLRSHRRSLPEDLAFHDRELGEGEHPVEAVVFVDGEPMVGEGRIAFHGAATSFSLVARDIVPRSRFAVHDPYLALPSDALRLRTPARDVVLRLIALDGHGAALFRDVSTFFRGSCPTDEPRQWPTTAPYVDSIEGGTHDQQGRPPGSPLAPS